MHPLKSIFHNFQPFLKEFAAKMLLHRMFLVFFTIIFPTASGKIVLQGGIIHVKLLLMQKEKNDLGGKTSS